MRGKLPHPTLTVDRLAAACGGTRQRDEEQQQWTTKHKLSTAWLSTAQHSSTFVSSKKDTSDTHKPTHIPAPQTSNNTNPPLETDTACSRLESVVCTQAEAPTSGPHLANRPVLSAGRQQSGAQLLDTLECMQQARWCRLCRLHARKQQQQHHQQHRTTVLV